MRIENHCKLILGLVYPIILYWTSFCIASNDLALNGTFGQRQGRWGIFFTYEPLCTKACHKNGKYSGRMYGGVCRCYCPRIETDPCNGNYPSCDRLCRQNNYHLGGDCIDETNCYCFCTVRQPQAPNGTTTAAPSAASTGAPAPPPSQGTLGFVGQTGAPAGGSYKGKFQ